MAYSPSSSINHFTRRPGPKAEAAIGIELRQKIAGARDTADGTPAQDGGLAGTSREGRVK